MTNDICGIVALDAGSRVRDAPSAAEYDRGVRVTQCLLEEADEGLSAFQVGFVNLIIIMLFVKEALSELSLEEAISHEQRGLLPEFSSCETFPLLLC